MRKIAIFLALFAIFVPASDIYATHCPAKGQVILETQRLDLATVSFYELIDLLTGYFQLRDNVQALAREARHLRRAAEESAGCDDITSDLSHFDETFKYVGRMLENSQYTHYRSPVVRQWRQVEAAYHGVKDAILHPDPAP